MTTRHVLRLAAAAALLVSATPAWAGTSTNPTKLTVKLFKTELYDGTSWTTIFSDANGASVDLVGNAGAAFGRGEVPVGTYGKLRLTVANAIAYSAAAVSAGVDTCAAVSDQQVLVNGSAAPEAQTTLAFATAALGGNTSWYANGSDANPLLMTAPVAVQDGQTTRVTLEFQTQDSVLCSGTTMSVLDAPAIAVHTLVVPPTPPFAGGTYWLAHYNGWQGGTDPLGNRIDPTTGTAADRQAYRKSAGFFLGWGAKVTFGAAGAGGAGTATLSGTMTENRREVDESWCQANPGANECGVVASAGSGDIGYAIDMQHRVTLSVPGGGSIYGAFNEDFSVLVGVAIEADGSNGHDLFVAVKQSGLQSLAGLYSFTTAQLEANYPIVSAVRQPLMDGEYVDAVFGWGKFVADAAAVDVEAYSGWMSLSNPGALPGTNPGDFQFSYGTKDVGGAVLPTQLLVGTDGVGTLTIPGMMEAWIAADPGGQTVILAGDTSELNRSSAPTTNVKFAQTSGVLLKQAAPGTQSLSTVEGTWIFANRLDELRRVDTNDGWVSKGAEYGVMTLDLAGVARFEITRNDERGSVVAETAVGDLHVSPVCVGSTTLDGTGGRLSWSLSASACATAGGEMLDVGVLTAPDGLGGSRAMAWFLFNENASVAALVSPDGFDAIHPDRNTFHMLGYAVHVAN